MTHTCTTCRGPLDDDDRLECCDCRTARRRAECYDPERPYFVRYHVDGWNIKHETDRLSLESAEVTARALRRCNRTSDPVIIDSATGEPVREEE